MSLKIFSGKTNTVLASKIAGDLQIPLGDIYHHNFPSGESFCKFQENIRGDDIFIVQGIIKPANENLMDILIMADAARRASAKSITAVIPNFGYARQDRKDQSRVPISAKLVMDMLTCAGIKRVLTMDLHAAQIQGFTNDPCDQLLFEPILSQYLKIKYGANPRDIVIVAPDVGAVKRAERYSKLLNCSLALIVKNRLGDTEVKIESFVGDVKGKIAIIVDDMNESAGTIVQAGNACRDRGATKIVAAVTHGCFTPTGCINLQDACSNRWLFDEFIYSDTVGYNWDTLGNYPFEKPKVLTELSVSKLFADAIKNIYDNKSVSGLFI